MLKRVPTRQEFEQMAARGRLHKRTILLSPPIPSSTRRNRRSTSVVCTATLKTILHTFISSGGALLKPHTKCGIYNKPGSRPLSVSLTSTSSDSLPIEAAVQLTQVLA